MQLALVRFALNGTVEVGHTADDRFVRILVRWFCLFSVGHRLDHAADRFLFVRRPMVCLIVCLFVFGLFVSF
jgi:hypothetical protein